MEIFHWFTNRKRVRIALALKNIDCKYIPVNLLKAEQLDSGYTDERNPMGQVPALCFDDNEGNSHVLTQSMAIIELLDEKYPDVPLLPRDSMARYRSREIAHIIGTGIQPVQNLSVLKKVVALTNEPSNKLKWGKEAIEAGFKAVEAKLDDVSTYCCGDEITLADICLIPQVYNANRFGVPMENYPNISRVHSNLERVELLARAHPSNQPDAVL